MTRQVQTHTAIICTTKPTRFIRFILIIIGWQLVPSLGGQGTRLNYGSELDDKSVIIRLPFDFVYYGNPYQALIICINGFVSPDTSKYDMAGNYYNYFFNWPIPTPGFARAQISPFWDDLSYTSSPNGVYIWSDTLTHKYVIEWYHLTNNNSSSLETFEMIISDPVYYPTATGDADILFQYNTIYNNDSGNNYASVGIENWEELIGLQYTFDNANGAGAINLANQGAILVLLPYRQGRHKGHGSDR